MGETEKYKEILSEHIEEIAEKLSKQKEIEIKTAKDGLTIYAVDRKKLNK